MNVCLPAILSCSVAPPTTVTVCLVTVWQIVMPRLVGLVLSLKYIVWDLMYQSHSLLCKHVLIHFYLLQYARHIAKDQPFMFHQVSDVIYTALIHCFIAGGYAADSDDDGS